MIFTTIAIGFLQYNAFPVHCSIRIFLIGGPSNDDSWIVLPQFCTLLHDLGDSYILSVYRFSLDVAALLLSFNP